MYKKILHAAEKKNARYHRKKGCIRSYTNERNIKSIARRESMTETAVQKAMKALKDAFYYQIVQNKKVYLLHVVTITTEFRKLLSLEALPGADHYRASLLKKKLLQDWQNVSFFQNKGYSDIIVSSDISVRKLFVQLVIWHAVPRTLMNLIHLEKLQTMKIKSYTRQ